jgi:hypothetical protein
MTLKIKPVRLNKSIYVRVPNDIADLIGIDKDAEFALTLETSGNEVSLVYSVKRASKLEVPLREISA